MREIKFRAWIKPNYYTNGNYMLEWQKDIKGITPNGIETPLTHTENGCFDVYDNEDIILMQYTGLKDENGVEIYEGDIVKEDGWDNLYLIVFEDCQFIAKKIGNHNGDIFTKRDKDLDGVLFPIVVGNIYENPELIKGE